MITSMLAMIVVWCLFYGRISWIILLPICIMLGIALSFLGRHKHTGILTIDVLAYGSNLNKVNSILKASTVFFLLVLCIWSKSPIVGIFLAIAVLILIVYVGGLKLDIYVHFLLLPVSFLLVSGLALLFEVVSYDKGIINIYIFNFWLSVTSEAQIRATIVMCRALGGLSCVYLLSLTTPMSEIISVLRTMHCPEIIIELMYLIYRYIFILLFMYNTMHDAAKSRLGFINFGTSVRTTGSIYSNLLSRSYRQANINFDAMESRCFDSQIRFLDNSKKVKIAHVLFAAGIIIFTLLISLLLH